MRELRSVAKRALGLAATAGLATLLTSASAFAVDKVTAVHAFPGFLVYTKTFLAMR